MQVKELKLANLLIKNNIFLAPMAGYTDYAFRHGVINLGIGLSFTELVSAKGLAFMSEGTKELLYSNGDTDKTAVQLFGADPYYMRSACESEYLKDFKIVDINMGCPVPKVFRNGEGSALLLDIKKAESIIKECVKSGKIITVKIRTGLVKGDDVATDFALMAEQAGASLMTIHARVREDYYSGEPDYNAIANAKNKVKIPIIANGGIFTVLDADTMIDKTGADGVMLARGIISNPFLISELLHKEPNITLKEFILNQIYGMKDIYGERRANFEFKKFIPYYLKGKNNTKDLKIAIMNAKELERTIELINKNF